MKVLLIGYPKSGKSTLGKQLAAESGATCRSTDDTMHLPWSEASEAVSHWFDGEYGIIEGVAVPRALRKWKERNPGEPPPCDKVIHLTTPHVPLTPRQEGMGKGIDTVLAEISADGWLNEVYEVR